MKGGGREGRKKKETLKKVGMIQFTAFSLRKTLQKEIVSCQPRVNPSCSLGPLAGPFHVHPDASLLLPPPFLLPSPPPQPTFTEDEIRDDVKGLDVDCRQDHGDCLLGIAGG